MAHMCMGSFHFSGTILGGPGIWGSILGSVYSGKLSENYVYTHIQALFIFFFDLSIYLCVHLRIVYVLCILFAYRIANGIRESEHHTYLDIAKLEYGIKSNKRKA